MKTVGKMTLTTPTDREIVMTRGFQAPRELVWEALTTPELLKRWLFGPPGWALALCEIDLRVGGRYRFEMHHVDGPRMAWGGVYRDIVRPERFVATERFDEAWYPGEAIVTQSLVE